MAQLIILCSRGERMADFIIEGGKRVKGEIKVQGSKNGSLPLVSAALLVKGKTVLKNCPELSDVRAALNILTYLGCDVSFGDNTAVIDCAGADKFDIPDSLMREMRSSVVFLGALMGRFKAAELSAPGGCEIGLRPIDLHLEAMGALGAEKEEAGGRIRFSCPQGLRGGNISLSFPSVGATENILLAACKAKGKTVIVNAAREPEIVELASFLNACGAHISGAGESVITVEGVSQLNAVEHEINTDRIAAATYLAAAAVTGGTVLLQGTKQQLLMPVLDFFNKAGCEIEQCSRGLKLAAPERLSRIPIIRTMPYPGFPTDSQADFAVMAAVSRGTTVIVENIFESRFKYIGELSKMGALARTEGRVAIIEGVECLHGAAVQSPDLRGGSALVVAGLCAHGTTKVGNICHIDRGYENFDEQLQRLGVNISRRD